MRGARLVGAVGLALLSLSACGGPENGNPTLPPTGTAGTSGGGPSGTVTVSIETPTTDSVLGAGTLVDVAARAFVEGGTDVIDRTSVTVRISKRGTDDAAESSQLVFDPSSADLFTGRVSLGDLATGEYTLTVRARSSGGATGQGSVDFIIDGGPTLIVRSPSFGGHYKNSVVVEIFADDPTEIAEVTARIADLPVTLEPLADPPHVYRGSFDFNAPNPPLVGEQIAVVTAVSGSGRRAEVRVVFTIDNEGPVITRTTPLPGEIVGNVVLISATVADEAGVLGASVVAIVGDERTPRFEIPLKPLGVGAYAAYFDTKRLTDCKDPPDTGLCIVFPTISFRASDQLGNERTVAYAFSVDNVAPLADLDPPPVRDSKIDEVLRCSRPFDPLSVGGGSGFVGNMPNDGKMAPQVFDLRARIEDDGNRAEGLKLVPIAGVSPDTTAVYVLDDYTQPLVVDTDGNGTCDSINPLLVPTSEPPTQGDQVLKVRLVPVPPAGRADFTPASDSAVAGVCLAGRDLEIPTPLCLSSQPTIAIGYAFTQPAIWGVDEVDGAHCLGGQFDALANNIGEGWACIAVGTTDKNGNFSVSAPLRVYIQYRGVGQPDRDPPASAGPPPSCTGRYDRASHTVAAGACSTRKFSPGGICYKGFDCN